MKKIIKILLGVVFLSSCKSTDQAQVKVTQAVELPSNQLPGIIALYDYVGNLGCTATFISDFVVLTAAHCVASSITPYTFIMNNGMLIPPLHVAINPKFVGLDATASVDAAAYDMALIVYPPVIGARESVRLRKQPINAGDKIFPVGYGYSDCKLKTGQGIRRRGQNSFDGGLQTKFGKAIELLDKGVFSYGGSAVTTSVGSTDAATCPGDSGGPILSSENEIIAITSNGPMHPTLPIKLSYASYLVSAENQKFVSDTLLILQTEGNLVVEKLKIPGKFYRYCMSNIEANAVAKYMWADKYAKNFHLKDEHDCRFVDALIRFGQSDVYLPNLHIKDLSLLMELEPASITTLVAYGNNFTDIAPLKTLSALAKLDIGSSSVTDLSALSGLQNLKEVSLHYNQIMDLRPLSSLTNIETLDVTGNPIHDLSPLANLTHMKTLGLTNIYGDIMVPVEKNHASCPVNTVNQALNQFCTKYLAH